jgi:drug/metabolite transporter (DMT)-like permease
MSSKASFAFPKKIPAATFALGGAFLFGASTPAAKVLAVHELSPQLLAGLLYMGSGLGLTIINTILSLTTRTERTKLVTRANLPSLAGVILCGGIIAPVMLMIGLRSTSGGATSLLLNLEEVMTAALAWFAFKEHFDKRIFLGMLAIVAGSVVLSLQPTGNSLNILGSLAIALACLCWALDNNLTRNIAEADSVQIAATKGLVAGFVNCTIAFACGAKLPTVGVIATAAGIGFLGYGVSLVLYINGLRRLGTSRAAAYFATAPFAGALLSFIFLHDSVSPQITVASLLMGIGVWLHLTEHHEHEHTHETIEHEHVHVHDEEHAHEHVDEPKLLKGIPHSHWHRHEAMTHTHPHYPDSQHRHPHTS